MHSKVCYAMLALPVIGWNAFGSFTTSKDLQLQGNEVSRITDVVTGTDENEDFLRRQKFSSQPLSGVKIVQPYLTPFQISARDDRIKDCLRSGNCKN